MPLDQFSFPDQFSTGQVPPSRQERGGAAPETAATETQWLTTRESASCAFSELSSPLDAQPIPDQDPSPWLARGIAALQQADPLLVQSLRGAASRFCPVIVVRGLPVSPLPPATPYDGVVGPAAVSPSIVNLFAVVGCLGLHPIRYARENASILHAVCPVTGARGELSSHGFDAALPFHTDYADRPIDEPVNDLSPAAAFLVFAVERAERATPMEYLPAHRLLAALSAEQIAIGSREEFAVRAPDLFGGGSSARVRRLFLSDGATGYRCRLNLGKMTGLTPPASRLLHEIRDILSEPGMVERLHVRRGDIVVVDNQRAIHRRARFAPRWDGTDRYFVRMSAVRDPHAGVAADPRRPWIWS